MLLSGFLDAKLIAMAISKLDGKKSSKRHVKSDCMFRLYRDPDCLGWIGMDSCRSLMTLVEDHLMMGL
jgi:hypothetical protein